MDYDSKVQADGIVSFTGSPVDVTLCFAVVEINSKGCERCVAAVCAGSSTINSTYFSYQQ